MRIYDIINDHALARKWSIARDNMIYCRLLGRSYWTGIIIYFLISEQIIFLF